MIKPYAYSCANHTIYRGRGSAIVLPSVYSTAFKASDGKIGQVFANYTEEAQKIAIDLGNEKFTLLSSDGKSVVLSGKAEFTVEPLSAVLIEK